MQQRTLITALSVSIFTWQAFSAVFVDPKIKAKLRINASNESIRSIIHFQDKRDLAAIVRKTPAGKPIGAFLAVELEKLTTRETLPMRNFLNSRKGRGVEEVTVLWGTNSLRVQSNSIVLGQLLALNANNVQSVILDEPLPVGEMLDQGLASFAPRNLFRINAPEEAGEFGGLNRAATNSWGVEKVNAHQVWETGNKGQKTLVAMIDSGAAIGHPDLAPNVWKNPGENGIDANGKDKATNGLDDDGNGYVDDVNGWNFEAKDGDVTDLQGHGSQTAGIVGGMGAGGTQTGVAPGAKLMILKSCCGVGGNAFESNTWEAIQYAIKNGAQVISMSLSAKPNSKPSYAKWRKLGEVELASGIIHVNSAGNLGTGNAPRNMGAPATNPPAWFHQDSIKGKGTSMITIGATDQEDVLRSYSSTGPVTWEGIEEFSDFPYAKGDKPGLVKPEVCGPSEVPSTSKDGTSYTKGFGGTSSATPNVAGVVALMVTAKPGLTPAQATEALVMSAIPVGNGYNNECGGGRVDAVKAIEYILKNF